MTTNPMAAWPTQIMLPGQAAAPAGAVDMTNMYLFHHAFRRDVGRFLGAVPRTPLDELATWRRLADRWAVFERQLHHHHEAEDRVLWPWLRERADTDELALLDAMEREHEAIDPALAAVRSAFADLSTTGGARGDVRAALVVRLTGLGAVLDQHLAHEETDAIALLQRVTTPADWTSIEKQFGQGQPVTALFEMIPWALDDVEATTRRTVVRRAPVPMRVLLRLLRPGFARRERAAFCYA